VTRPIRNLRSISLLNYTRVALSGAHGQGNVKSSLALLTSVHALRHELRKFAVEVRFKLRVALVLLAFDNYLLVLLAMFAMRRIVSLLLLVRLVHASGRATVLPRSFRWKNHRHRLHPLVLRRRENLPRHRQPRRLSQGPRVAGSSASLPRRTALRLHQDCQSASDPARPLQTRLGWQSQCLAGTTPWC
jgi:hypothetical protein